MKKKSKLPKFGPGGKTVEYTDKEKYEHAKQMQVDSQLVSDRFQKGRDLYNTLAENHFTNDASTWREHVKSMQDDAELQAAIQRLRAANNQPVTPIDRKDKVVGGNALLRLATVWLDKYTPGTPYEGATSYLYQPPTTTPVYKPPVYQGDPSNLPKEKVNKTVPTQTTTSTSATTPTPQKKSLNQYYKPDGTVMTEAEVAAFKAKGDTQVKKTGMQYDPTQYELIKHKNGGKVGNKKLPKAKDGHWIEHAHLKKGLCTPMTKSTCTPRRKALARTFKKHHGFHEDGGAVPMQDPSQQMPPMEGGQGPSPQQQQQVMQQMLQMVMQALQQGQKPEQIMQMLVQKGVPQEVAQQVIQMAMQQAQGGQQGPQEPQQEVAPVMKYGGLPIADITNKVSGIGTPLAGQELWSSAFKDAPNPASSAPANLQQPQVLMPGYQQEQSPDVTPPAPTGMEGQTQFNSDYKYSPPKPASSMGKYYGPLSNYGHMQYGMRNLKENERIAADPNSTPEQVAAAKRGEKFSGMEFGVGMGNLITGDLKAGVSSISKVFSDQRNARENFGIAMHQRMNEDENNAINQQTRHGVGQLRNGVLPYNKYGGKLPVYGAGGMPTEGSDFDSQDPNVVTERGEVISDPTKGPIGPDGQPTGVVVHDKTGDLHSDPSGGNAYKLGADAVIHSKSLAVKVGWFVKYAAQFPDAAYIIGKVQEKYPNPEKEVTFAQLASIFDTKKLIKEVEKIAKKADKAEEASDGNEKTKITKTTAKLNKETLANKLEDTHQQLAQNTDATGPQGPIYNMAETLKHSGAYGEDIKKQAQDPNNVPMAKFGKKVRLPNYSVGGKYNKEAIGIPTAGGGKMVNGVWVEDPKEGTNSYTVGEMLTPQPIKEQSGVPISEPSILTPKELVEPINLYPETPKNLYTTDPYNGQTKEEFPVFDRKRQEQNIPFPLGTPALPQTKEDIARSQGVNIPAGATIVPSTQPVSTTFNPYTTISGIEKNQGYGTGFTSASLKNHPEILAKYPNAGTDVTQAQKAYDEFYGPQVEGLPDPLKLVAADHAFNSENPWASLQVAAGTLTPAEKIKLYTKENKTDLTGYKPTEEQKKAVIDAYNKDPQGFLDKFAAERNRSNAGNRGVSPAGLKQQSERVALTTAEAKKLLGTAQSATAPTSTPATNPYYSMDNKGNYTWDRDVLRAAVDRSYAGNKTLQRGSDQPKSWERTWNAGIFKDDPEVGLTQLAKEGFDPSKYGKTWANFNADNMQDFILSTKKGQELLPGIFEKYKNTTQGRAYMKSKGLNENYKWSLLSPAEQKAWFQDNIEGVRTDLAMRYFGKEAPADEGSVAEGEVKKPFQPEDKTWSQIPADKKTGGFWGEALNPLQVASPLFMMMQAKSPIPLIRSHGNQNAAEASVEERPTDIQAQLNRIGRARRAQTNHSQDASENAQAYANQYSAEEPVYENKYNQDKGIHQQAMQLRNQYMAAAGKDKADALNQLLERTATRDWKDTANTANAIGTYGHDWMKQFLNNSQANLALDTFGGSKYNPWGTTEYNGSGSSLVIGPSAGGEVTRSVKREDDGTETEIVTYRNGETVTRRRPSTVIGHGKYGSKVKKLPKKLPGRK